MVDELLEKSRDKEQEEQSREFPPAEAVETAPGVYETDTMIFVGDKY